VASRDGTGRPSTVVEWRLKQSGSRCIEMTVSFANAEILRCAQNDAVVHRCISKQRAGHFDRLNDRPGTAVQWLGATSTGGPRTVIEWRLKQSGSRCIEMTVACANAEIPRSAQNDGVVHRCISIQRPGISTGSMTGQPPAFSDFARRHRRPKFGRRVAAEAKRKPLYRDDRGLRQRGDYSLRTE